MQSWRQWWPMALIAQSLAFGCNSSASCPHPGVPVNGFGVVAGDDRPILPIRRDQFHAGDSLTFFCSRDRRIPSTQRATIACQSDGTWNGPLPRCDQVLNVERMVKPSPTSCQNSTDVTISSADRFRISDIRVTLCQELRELLNVSLLTNDAGTDSIFEKCRKMDDRSLMQTFSCENLTSTANGTFIRISSEHVAIYSVAILERSSYQCGYPPDMLHSTWRWVNATRVHYQCIDSLLMIGDEYSTCHPETGLWGPPPTCQLVGMKVFAIVTGILSLIISLMASLLLIVWKRLCCCKKKAAKESIEIFFTSMEDNIDFTRSMDEVSNHGFDKAATTEHEMDSLPVPTRQSAMPPEMLY